MYIDPFWCGVLATFGGELAVIVLAIIVAVVRSRKGRDD